MRNKIINALKQLEKEHNIEILLACETGSRAWGFPSPDSDYDVRFIYVHKPEWYLSLNEKKDSIDLMMEDRLIDLSGWELRKTLRLLAKSNVSVLERMQSEIVYLGKPDFQEELQEIARKCFSPIVTMHHYLSMSKSFYERIVDQNEVRLKDYFYALRTAVAGKWVREKNAIPPLQFTEMYDLLDKALCEKLEELITLKGEKEEAYRHLADKEINAFLKDTIRANEAVSQKLPSGHPDWEQLDQFFRRWIR
ncbi:MAG TPA: nucleotidyltransferase domain-containing protein [Cryomorphaceae bacterium]|nr:nucleotidyltransferase [Owenweeksia sp.]HAD97632.1 nucleotidyltransferase domain-containing protein [Cryomorphaceae bacterium]HBF21011.1 nucleotidyltransferase domain-containing protein [Cryomorphaceae bacterium]HCQ17604.1 nucleotidyltransferase domain-containing protein [Cryomorphaceae bacterium]|tara:strand:+ start:1075 stop:1827 length:753 start_codon:yes stop_codon:yes gene_type:complete